MMKKDFLKRVIRERIVDTKNYRYIVDDTDGYIKRLPISFLDTTLANTEWQDVCHVNDIH